MKNGPRVPSYFRFGLCLCAVVAAAFAPPFAAPAATITPQARLEAFDPAAGAQFGHSVAVSGDTMVIGAPYELVGVEPLEPNTPRNPGAGAAYVFVRSGTNWILQAHLKASNPGGFHNAGWYEGDHFGYSVAVSGDTVVVGAPYEASKASGINGDQNDDSAPIAGAAYVFVRSGTNWTQQAYLKASNAQGWDPFGSDGDFFGWSVAISGDTAVVGAIWEESNATGVNGNQHDNSAPSSGAAYVFVRSGTSWTQQAYLKASNTQRDAHFGISVAMSADTVVVGAFREDSNGTGVNGDQSDNSAYNSGAAYVFVRSGTNWAQQAYLKATSHTEAAEPPYQPGGVELHPDYYGDFFGYSVAISGDTVVVGAFEEDSSATGVNGDAGDNSAPNSGAAYVFVRSHTNWTQEAYLKASNTEAGDQFGGSVAVSGDTVVVGAALRYGRQALPLGAAYVFGRNGTNWSQQADLQAYDPFRYSNFGFAVALSGDTTVVGAPWAHHDFDTTYSGAADIFAVPALDSDRDGVPDRLDQCPGTSPGAVVDTHGCSADQRDSDSDGVPDSRDRCPNTPAGVITDATGCSIEQLVPCHGPWRNRGEYLRALREVISFFVTQGFLNEAQAVELLRKGIHSDCGREK